MRRPASVVAVTCLLGAQAIHTAVLPSHWVQWRVEGLFFLGLALIEGALAAGLLLAPSRRVALVAGGASLATVAVWAWTRTLGLPLGPGAGTPEPVGRADLVATLLEVATAVALLPRAARPARALSLPTVAAVALITAIGLAGAGDHAHQAHGPGAVDAGR